MFLSSIGAEPGSVGKGTDSARLIVFVDILAQPFFSNIALLPRAVSILVCFFCIPGKTSFNATQGMECGAHASGLV